MLQNIIKIIALLLFVFSGFLLFTSGYFANTSYDNNFDKQIQEQKVLASSLERLNDEFAKNQNLIAETELKITNQKTSSKESQDKLSALENFPNSYQTNDSKNLEIINTKNQLINSDLTLKKLESEALVFANKKNELTKILQKTEQEQKQTTQELRANLGLVASQWVFYTFVIFGYLLVYRLIIWLHSRYFAHTITKKKLRQMVRAATSVLIIFTILYALSEYFATILTTFGFISAALVFSLQNYIASLFAFAINNTVTPMYKVGDIVTIGPSYFEFTGRISHAGLFFTSLEKIDKNNELEEGKVVFVMNVNMLKEPFINLTSKNHITWNTIGLVLEPSENIIVAKESLQELLTAYFESKITEFGNNYEKYRPKIYLKLSKEGLEATIHIACEFGDFAKTQDEIVQNIINKFKEQKIIIKS